MSGEGVAAVVAQVFAEERIDTDAVGPLVPLYTAVADRIAARARDGEAPLIVGVCGAQGSGKSTLALVVERLLDHAGFPTARFSLDDLYLPAASRRRLAETVHPLLRTRGVPGTHDVALGEAFLRALADAGPASATPVPTFDKARDDRLPEAMWPVFKGRPRVILFEGWCVGARPQEEPALRDPVNDLERDADSDGVWRYYVNDQLAGVYRGLFGQLDMLVMLRAPGFDQVFAWRRQQEDKLRDRLRAAGGDEQSPGVMDDAQLERFIRHYERLTRHILAEMPDRADIVIRLQGDRSVAGWESRPEA